MPTTYRFSTIPHTYLKHGAYFPLHGPAAMPYQNGFASVYRRVIIRFITSLQLPLALADILLIDIINEIPTKEMSNIDTTTTLIEPNTADFISRSHFLPSANITTTISRHTAARFTSQHQLYRPQHILAGRTGREFQDRHSGRFQDRHCLKIGRGFRLAHCACPAWRFAAGRCQLSRCRPALLGRQTVSTTAEELSRCCRPGRRRCVLFPP